MPDQNTYGSTRPTKAAIDLDNLAFNFHSTMDLVGEDVSCMAVVKANAYGHGAAACARRLEAEGVDQFAVALLEEGVGLRNAGITMPILCLGGVWPGQEAAFLDHAITPAIFDIESARRFDHAARERRSTAAVHVKLDTGMGRVGVPWRGSAEFAAVMATLSNLEVQGLMTHFAAADDLAETDFTNEQIARFDASVEAFRAVGIDPEFVDLANSPGAVAHPNARRGLVRLGGVLYGLGGDVLPAGIPVPQLKPVMSVRTALAQVKHVARGETLGYGRTFKAVRDSIIGTIPIGYDDGFRRGLSNVGRVIVAGSFAPVAGRVSMDWTIIDLTDVPLVSVGDEVVVIGEMNGLSITAEEIAAALGTISYEVTCGISARGPRTYRPTPSSSKPASE